jgi:toxin ParE1/3/4
MAQSIKTPRARLDLDSIVRHISQDNLEAALRWLQDAERLFELLAEQPGIGQSVMSRRYGPLRRHTMGNYLIYYRPILDGVQIIRVVHGSRDQNRLI